MATQRKPGLLHPLRAVEVQQVSTAMKLVCAHCGERPNTRRLLVKTGSARHATQKVYCVDCGHGWLTMAEWEYSRAGQYLRHGAIKDEMGPRDSIRVMRNCNKRGYEVLGEAETERGVS